jgi:hypothetical protein
MARRRYSYGSSAVPTPPRAFMGSAEVQCQAAIRKMAIEQRFLATRDITVEDLRQLFVPAEYRHSLKEAFSVGSQIHTDEELVIPVRLMGDHYPEGYPLPQVPGSGPLKITFTWDRNDCPDGFFVMKNMGKDAEVMIQPDAPQELVDKWLYVSDNLMRISYEFGMVREVFNKLNVNGFCNTPQQMRFLWPAIRHIVDKAGIKELAAQLVETSARAGDRARIPTELTEFMVPTVNIVNRTLLIDKVELIDRPFKVTVNDPAFATPQGLTFSGMH